LNGEWTWRACPLGPPRSRPSRALSRALAGTREDGRGKNDTGARPESRAPGYEQPKHTSLLNHGASETIDWRAVSTLSTATSNTVSRAAVSASRGGRPTPPTGGGSSISRGAMCSSAPSLQRFRISVDGASDKMAGLVYVRRIRPEKGSSRTCGDAFPSLARATYSSRGLLPMDRPSCRSPGALNDVFGRRLPTTRRRSWRLRNQRPRPGQDVRGAGHQRGRRTKPSGDVFGKVTRRRSKPSETAFSYERAGSTVTEDRGRLATS